MKPYTAAVVQAASVLFEPCRTLEKLRDLASDAAARGARLAVFPEAFIGGYPRGLTFGAKVGGRTPEGRELFKRYHESAIDVPGPQVDVIGKAAADNHLHLVVGVIERDQGTLYCTVLVFADDGRYLGKHRKLMPTAMERIIWGFGDGSTLSVFPTDVGRIGPVICWENYMPLLRMAMYSKGVQIYCAPTADMRATWLATMQHIALEGRCFVLSANQFVRQSDYPKDLWGELANAPAPGARDAEAAGPDSVVSTGGSCIVSPLGKVLAGPNHEEETILTAEIDLDEIVRGKYDFDVVGHYARPDVFQLHVNESVQASVVTRGSD